MRTHVKVQIDLESLCGGIMLGCMNEKRLYLSNP